MRFFYNFQANACVRTGHQENYNFYLGKVNPRANQLNPGVLASPIEVQEDTYARSPLNVRFVGDHLDNKLKVALIVHSITFIDPRFTVPNVDGSDAGLRPAAEAN